MIHYRIISSVVLVVSCFMFANAQDAITSVQDTIRFGYAVMPNDRFDLDKSLKGLSGIRLITIYDDLEFEVIPQSRFHKLKRKKYSRELYEYQVLVTCPNSDGAAFNLRRKGDLQWFPFKKERLKQNHLYGFQFLCPITGSKINEKASATYLNSDSKAEILIRTFRKDLEIKVPEEHKKDSAKIKNYIQYDIKVNTDTIKKIKEKIAEIDGNFVQYDKYIEMLDDMSCIYLYTPTSNSLKLDVSGIAPKEKWIFSVDVEDKIAKRKCWSVGLSNSFIFDNMLFNPQLHAGYNASVGIGSMPFELGVVFGTKKSSEIYIYDSNGSVKDGYRYNGWFKGYSFFFRTGYEFRLGAVTIGPLLGVSLNRLQGKRIDGISNAYKYGDGTNTWSFLCDGRISFSPCNCLRIHVTPEYRFEIGSDKSYKSLSEHDDIKKWTEGFCLNLGIIIYPF